MYFTQPHLAQNIYPVKYDAYGRLAKPMRLERTFNVAVKQERNSVPHAAAGAPGYAEHFKRTQREMRLVSRICERQ